MNNTIVVAFANANALDYTFNWLTYVFANNITNYLIGAIDRTTEMTLADAGVNCFSMYDSRVKEAAELPEGSAALDDCNMPCQLSHMHA